MHLLNLILLILFIILMVGSSICKAIGDTVQCYFATSLLNVFFEKNKWWNPLLSYRNKYKNRDLMSGKSAFFGSRTIFIMFTDAWHFFKNIFMFPLYINIILYVVVHPLVSWALWPITDFLIMATFYYMIYELTFSVLNPVTHGIGKHGIL